jgi:TRAP-type C4-dicarboxylate transport system substrate-binding protein
MSWNFENLGALAVGGIMILAVSGASAQQVRWRASGSFTASHSASIAMETFKSEVARLSKNTIQVDLFPGNTLGGGFEQVDQLRTGQIQMAWGGMSFYDKLVPELSLFPLQRPRPIRRSVKSKAISVAISKTRYPKREFCL